MAGSKSNYLENATLDALYGSGTPTNIYFALYTVAPTDAGGGTEVSGTGYARKAMTNNDTNFPDAVSGVKSNGTAITFAEAESNWGTIVAMASFDAAAGNLLHWATLTNSRSYFTGDVPSFAPGAFVVTED
jgi:hypothetical protein